MPPSLRRNNPELTENLNGNHSARIRSAAKSTLQKQHMTGAMEPHANDILMGRGGKNNQHVGNEKFRGLARLQSERYRLASKKGKSTISRELVRQVRMMNPPGRFLRKNIDSGELEDVGDDVAREKASQVLRDAVSVTTPSQQGDEQESEGETVQREEKVAVSSEQKRPVSAPTVMATLPRRRSWEETERYSYETHRYEPRLYETRSYDSGRYDAQNTPAPVTSAYYPPVTPSLSSAKRLRYHSDAWDDRLVSQVQTSPIVSSQYRYRDYARPYASEPNIYGRDIYAPEARVRDTNPGLDEFDLFNGKLLESDVEEE